MHTRSIGSFPRCRHPNARRNLCMFGFLWKKSPFQSSTLAIGHLFHEVMTSFTPICMVGREGCPSVQYELASFAHFPSRMRSPSDVLIFIHARTILLASFASSFVFTLRSTTPRVRKLSPFIPSLASFAAFLGSQPRIGPGGARSSRSARAGRSSAGSPEAGPRHSTRDGQCKQIRPNGCNQALLAKPMMHSCTHWRLTVRQDDLVRHFKVVMTNRQGMESLSGTNVPITDDRIVKDPY